MVNTLVNQSNDGAFPSISSIPLEKPFTNASTKNIKTPPTNM